MTRNIIGRRVDVNGTRLKVVIKHIHGENVGCAGDCVCERVAGTAVLMSPQRADTERVSKG